MPAAPGRVPRGRVGLRRGLRRGRLPAVRVPLRGLVARRGDRGPQRAGPRPGAARLQPRRVALPVRRLDDPRRDHEGAPASPLGAVHGPGLGLRPALPLVVHAPGGRGAGQPLQRDAPARAGRAGDGLPRGGQGNRQAVLGALPAASGSAGAASSRWRCGPARRSSRLPSSAPRRSIPSSRESRDARTRGRGAVRADHPDLPVARAARAGAAAVAVADRVLRADRPLRATAPTRPTTGAWCSTSPNRSARRSSRRSSRTSRSEVRRSCDRGIG